MDCLFCKIVNKDIESDIIFEDEQLIAFNDINPQSPVHVLIIPKKHITTINEVHIDDSELMGQMILTAKKLAKAHNLSESGYRLVFNINQNGGQEIYHIHLHLLGGRKMTWPPG